MTFMERLKFVWKGLRSVRAYAAAKMGRLTGDWLAVATSIDADIRSGMIPVRSRARDLSQNNEYAKAYLRAVKKNVIGSEGFKLQVKPIEYVDGQKKPDRLATNILEQAFKEWSKPDTATVTGKVSFRKAQEIVIETVARDGEAFIRLIRNENINRFGFSLQLIEPDWIDEKLNYELPGGSVVRMGIEVDRWRRPVAYYLSTRNHTLDVYGNIFASAPHERIPADDMIHMFDPERADQTRGISWMAPAMLGMHNLKGYIEAAIVNARSGANKLGFFRNAANTSGEYTGDGTDASGNKTLLCEPGSFEDIGDKEFTPYDPKYPEAQFDPFTKSILRGISAGLGVSFSSLSNDLTEVNFSSIRAGLIEERETWKSIQSWMIESMLDRVYGEWLFMTLMVGAVNLPATKYRKFNAPTWIGRRWAWVDPLKEVQAYKEAVAAGFKSATQIVAEGGGDIAELYAEMKAEKDLAKEYGLELDFGSGGTKNGKQGTDGSADVSGGGSGTADAGNPDGQTGSGVGKGGGKVGRSLLLV
ncbi:MAG: phage portal protein [Deltaproteobacteria bacterium]|nr:MAG: phage portal protein [Deltaproteobacteria bacterium]